MFKGDIDMPQQVGLVNWNSNNELKKIYKIIIYIFIYNKYYIVYNKYYII